MRRIERLSESVINRIAAGEVVQRPSAALKELLENALDAGSTSIQVLAQDGGLQLLQVADDGHGICYDDLPLLCERYATSKLRAFEDLSRISSFGFRGEALSSISYVSRVTVTTMRRAVPDETSAGTLAWRCHFMDGAMQGEPKPCAGNPGTCIRVEKMFYNAVVRRRALSRPSEEYSRIVAIVSRYALAFPHVAFSCRREEGSISNGGKAEVVFPKESTTLANIRLFHGAVIASHLHELRCVGSRADTCSPADVLATTGDAGADCFHITGYTSGLALPNRKSYLCLFVNSRLVESAVVRRALDTVYSGVLTGGNHPFTVLFITVPPDRVDVNIHPTKHEVCLLDEEIIVARLSEAVRAALMDSAARRQINTRPILAKAAALGDRGAQLQQLSSSLPAAGGVTAAPCTLVRVEPQRGALDAYMRRASVLPGAEGNTVLLDDNDGGDKDGERKHSGASEAVALVKTEVVESREEQGARVMTVAATTAVETDAPPTTASLVASIMRLGGGGGGANSADDATKEEDDEDEEEEDGGYVMQHFKRHRREIHEAVGSADGSGEPTTTAPERGTGKETAVVETDLVTDGILKVTPDNCEDLLLTSVATIVAFIRQATSPTAQSLFEKLAYVGVVNGRFFLAQSGTTLYAIDTLRLVRLVVYQRIFLRWAAASVPAPPQLVLQDPVKVSDLLRFALQQDVQLPSGTAPCEDTQRIVTRMERRLRHWRCMLQEYFAIEITDDGHLVALPFGLNASWPPPPRVVPLFVWRLAAEVPYDGGDEAACFTAIARHIADTLYSLRLHDAWCSAPVPADDAGEVARDGVPSLVDAIRFGLVPCATSMKFFAPPADALIDGTVQTVVSVEELYKVFERC
ncbi:mismatch repair protein MLH1 [Trypanosoma grayi]|uniref:mismatch repair protein MLH1 n=1 Tax=Trypanosoma grayi TaxID=71804 RepID=UPI0004F445A6|nr:mismatch repair protein MLH1 [Trypanosoma grayi]KEG12037.1 mismatch repair protein MLH1 [Trypanosoma grayi]